MLSVAARGHRWRWVQLIFWLSLVASCSSVPSTKAEGALALLPPLRSTELGSMHNVSVSGRIWLGSLPTRADLSLAQRRGIATAIDLALPAESADYDIRNECLALGIAYVTAGLQQEDQISDEVVDRILQVVRSREGQPLLLFCGNGSRAALFFAIHRAIDDEMPAEQALVEARRAGMRAGACEDFFRTQVARLQARGRSRQASSLASSHSASPIASH